MTNREFYHFDEDCDGAFPEVFDHWCFSDGVCEHRDSGDVDMAADCQRCYERWLDLEYNGGVE